MSKKTKSDAVDIAKKLVSTGSEKTKVAKPKKENMFGDTFNQLAQAGAERKALTKSDISDTNIVLVAPRSTAKNRITGVEAVGNAFGIDTRVPQEGIKYLGRTRLHRPMLNYYVGKYVEGNPQPKCDAVIVKMTRKALTDMWSKIKWSRDVVFAMSGDEYEAMWNKMKQTAIEVAPQLKQKAKFYANQNLSDESIRFRTKLLQQAHLNEAFMKQFKIKKVA